MSPSEMSVRFCPPGDCLSQIVLPAVVTTPVAWSIGVGVKVGVGVAVGDGVVVGVAVGVVTAVGLRIVDGLTVVPVAVGVDVGDSPDASVASTVFETVSVIVGGPPKAPVDGVALVDVGVLEAIGNVIGVSVVAPGAMLPSLIGVPFGCSVDSAESPRGTPARKKPMASSSMANAYPL